MNEPVIIVGAGAAGLMGAYELCQHSYDVTVIEAQDYIGGRMHTIIQKGFQQAIETGAEFIHGNLPVTLQLLKHAGISYSKVEGEMVNVYNGAASTDNEEDDDDWSKLLKAMKKLKQDITMQQFLSIHFSDDKYGALREKVKGFAGGFDLADLNKAGVFALRDEWLHEDEEQYRIDGGYIKLAHYLQAECVKNKVTFITGCTVQKIIWQPNKVEVTTADGKNFYGSKVLVTVPMGVLQSGENNAAHIRFTPQLKQQMQAAANIAFGNVIKFILQFNNSFWNKLNSKAGFIFSNEEVPVWWTQYPHNNGLITGWLGGPAADAFNHFSDDELLSKAILTLSNIFQISISNLQQQLVAHNISNWLHHPFSKGAYSYSIPQSAAAKKILQTPVEDTIYFAGEATYSGKDAGTVEAALVSGREAIKLMKK